MLLEVVSIYDVKLGAYSQPSFVASKGVAMRSFCDQVNTVGSPMNSHPEDYALYHIGKFEDTTGELIPLNFNGLEVEEIIKASDCIEKR